jgi:threonine dehydrogenase-like Zn-dependent dehydrogenase
MGYNPLFISEVNETRVNIAKSSGAEIVSGDIYASIMEKTGNYGVDIVIDTTGNIGLLEQAFNMVSGSGRILAFAVYDPDALAGIKPSMIYKKEIKVSGEFTNPFTMQRALNLISSRQINLNAMLHGINIDEIKDVLDGKFKEIIKPVMVRV